MNVKSKSYRPQQTHGNHSFSHKNSIPLNISFNIFYMIDSKDNHIFFMLSITFFSL